MKKLFPDFDLQETRPCKRDADLVQTWQYRTERRRDNFRLGKFKTF